MNKKSFICNILLVILELIGFYFVIFKTGRISLLMYTIDSNILCLITSTLFIIFYLSKKDNKLIHTLRFITTLSLTITFIIASTLLSFTSGFYNMMINGEFIYFHLLCPIISFISFGFERYSVTLKEMLLVPLITIIYGVFVLILNILKVVEGPYPFFLVYQNELVITIVSLVLIIVGVYLISFLLYKAIKVISVG